MSDDFAGVHCQNGQERELIGSEMHLPELDGCTEADLDAGATQS